MFSLRVARLGVLDRAGDRRAAEPPPTNRPSCAHELARHQEALLVVDAHDLVDDLQVHRAGKEVLADALDLVGEGLGDPPAS